MTEQEVTDLEVDALHEKLNAEAEQAGYHLNPDVEFTKNLIRGMLINEKRFGYWACPCRLASGKKEEDLDIICPCDYRDPDLTDHGTCYCALYVSKEVVQGKKSLDSIPERRLPPGERRKKKEKEKRNGKGKETEKGPAFQVSRLSLPVYRCRVCGYLCARETPPLECPICKVGKERFERFM
jgi:ferredoxin-thioredoxin reductase catalytic subunit/rubredoxin